MKRVKRNPIKDRVFWIVGTVGGAVLLIAAAAYAMPSSKTVVAPPGPKGGGGGGGGGGGSLAAATSYLYNGAQITTWQQSSNTWASDVSPTAENQIAHNAFTGPSFDNVRAQAEHYINGRA